MTQAELRAPSIDDRLLRQRLRAEDAEDALDALNALSKTHETVGDAELEAVLQSLSSPPTSDPDR